MPDNPLKDPDDLNIIETNVSSGSNNHTGSNDPAGSKDPAGSNDPGESNDPSYFFTN